MLVRLFRLLVLATAPVILVALPARAAPEKIEYTGDAKPGTIVIESSERRLYLITKKDQALKYTVGVGRNGRQWYGTTRIASKHIKPAWKPPASLRGKRSPDFYIDGGTPQNPMGAAALVLVHNELAIHGTNNPGSIGDLVSAGCSHSGAECGRLDLGLASMVLVVIVAAVCGLRAGTKARPRYRLSVLPIHNLPEPAL